MPRKTGYIASIDNVPPLIFRFQYNPELLSEKKSYKYDEGDFGKWEFDKTKAGKGFFGTIAGLVDDAKEIGSLLVNTKPLKPNSGEARSFSIDLTLDATVPGPLDDGDHYGGSIEPDLAVLRSFMNPSLDLIDITKVISGGFKEISAWNKPPECSFVYGGTSLACVMTDLNIKITAFQDDGSARRADVSVTLKEQTYSFSPLVEFVKRNINVAKSYNRAGIGKDFMSVTPILSLFT